MAFADPVYVLFLLPVGLAAWRLLRHGSPDRIRFASFTDMPPRRLTWRILVSRLATPMLVAGLVLMVLALARPQDRSTRTHRTAEAIAIEMVLDVSGSMARPAQPTAFEDASATAPTRLDIVKACFDEFVRQRPDDLIGLVTFGGYAVTRAPLTADHAALRHVLDSVAIPGTATGDDAAAALLQPEELLTAIGDAIVTACARLRESTPASRILLLLTDGGSNAGIADPLHAAQLARQLGIRIYTIAVGTERPIRSDTETPRGTPPEVAQLRAIAARTGGRYADAGSAADIRRALRDISRLEKTKVTLFTEQLHRDRFTWFLLPALALIAVAVLINMTLRRRIL